MKTIVKFKVKVPFNIDEEIRKYKNLLTDDNTLKVAPKNATYKFIYFNPTGWGGIQSYEKIKTIIFSMIALTEIDFIGIVFNKIPYLSLDTDSLRLGVTNWLIQNGNNPALSESSLLIRERLDIDYTIRNFITGDWVSLLNIDSTPNYPADAINTQWVKFE